MSENNKTWPAFWSENKPLVWFITLAVTAASIYLIYNKWGLIICGATLTPPGKANEEVVKEPNTNQTIEKSKVKEINSPSNSQTQPLVKAQQEVPKQLVNITLIVTAEFEKGEIFINEKQVYPVEETPTIKYLKIDYQPNLRIEVKSGNKIYSVKKSISKSELDKPILLTCTQ